MGDKTIAVKADTALDFVKAGRKAMKSGAKLGDTKGNFKAKWSLDPKSKKIKSATFTLTTDITRVTWGGAAKNKPDTANEAAIKQVETLIKAHEEAHADGYEKAFKKNKDKLEKELVDKTEKEAKGIVQKMHDALLDACETLHKTGGLVEVTDNGSGKVTVTE